MCKISCGCSGADLTKDARLFWLQIRKSLGMRYIGKRAESGWRAQKFAGRQLRGDAGRERSENADSGFSTAWKQRVFTYCIMII